MASSAGNDLFTAKTLVSAAATAMLLRSAITDLLPIHIRDHFSAAIRSFFDSFSSQLTMVIYEFDGLISNKIYDAALTYMGRKISPSTRRLSVTKPEKEKTFTITMEPDEEIEDFFDGAKFKWVSMCYEIEPRTTISHNRREGLNPRPRYEVRYLELTFHKKHRDMAVNSYLPFILEKAKSMKQEVKTQKIFTADYVHLYGNLNDAWISTNLDHPATFETVALDPEIKKFVLEDLERFVRAKEYYRKVGKAWKRGYLLYGPPGTGKSSLIAAMANYLRFDIYDLELSELECNSELRRLLIAVANRSILVVEDIDCAIEFQDRKAESKPDSESSDKQVRSSFFSFSFLL